MQLSFIRFLFLLLCILFSTTYALSISSEGVRYVYLATALAGGLVFGMAIISLEILLRKFELRAFNTITVGLFFGWLMGEALLLVFHTVVNESIAYPGQSVMLFIRACVFLCSIYVGMMITARASDRISVSIPFIKFSHNSQSQENDSKSSNRKKILIDSSLPLDPRFFDVASSGLLDTQLILPRYIAKEFHENLEAGDENIRSRGRRGLDALKKIESLHGLELEYTDLDFPEIKDVNTKSLCVARLLNSNILTADPLQVSQFSVENVKIINLNSLMATLKPLAQIGEFITIKIQRYGKEPRQGVGYLDDGTMVVVNGGAEYIGEGIRVQVLSVKHTASGRMIFCNTIEETEPTDSILIGASELSEVSSKNYSTI